MNVMEQPFLRNRFLKYLEKECQSIRQYGVRHDVFFEGIHFEITTGIIGYSQVNTNWTEVIGPRNKIIRQLQIAQNSKSTEILVIILIHSRLVRILALETREFLQH